ncbi:MAG: hypothetical protein AUJ85_09620 [Elusimicrobia bacterium CG1_02_37_114]|nr:MAG: hypothetical protein AUJ85_09620 [Elusimicrobia bacterium CG1_02_37_114]PIZ13854.1 MAG: hypothetical protein COY53_02660 [Elusimicrobia bacterium CG_4_10_14_0_8_um_filter_37_32]
MIHNISNRDKVNKKLTQSDLDKIVILNTIRKSSLPLTRTKIAQITGIRLPRITHYVKNLICDGFIIEDIPQQKSNKEPRKNIPLKINGQKGFVIGIELHPDWISGVLVDLAGNLVKKTTKKPDLSKGTNYIIDMLIGTINEIGEGYILPEKKILKIGISDPGLVDIKKGISIFSTIIDGWENIPLGDIISEKFKIPVIIESAPRAKAWAEKCIGAGKDVNNLIFIEYGPGIGAGIIMDGKLFYGTQYTAGEFGHTYIKENRQPCTCGASGCLESLVSTAAIIKHVRSSIEEGTVSSVSELVDGDLNNITFEVILKAAKMKDKLCMNHLDEIGEYIGIGIANLVNLFNPEMIMFDNQLAQIDNFLITTIENIVKRRALSQATKSLKFEVSNIGTEKGALGVSVLVLDQIFKTADGWERSVCKNV